MWCLPLLCLLADPSADERIEKAEALIASGRAEQAVLFLQEALERDPPPAGSAGEIRLRLAVGDAARAAFDWEAAAEAFRSAATSTAARAPATDGADGADGGREAALAAAECFLEMKDAVSASAIVELCAGAGDPALRGRVEEVRGIILFLQGREEEAAPHLEKARSAGRPGAAHHLGLAFFHRGDRRGAIPYFVEAVKADPGDYYSLLYHGWALLELNDLDSARTTFEKTRRVAATAEVEELLGRVELRAERLDRARERFEGALRENPRFPEALFGLATVFRRLGKPAEAKEALSRFRELHRAQQEDLRIAYEMNQRHLADPANAVLAEELGSHHFRRGDRQEAERFAWIALGREPRRISARLLLARSLAGSGRYREAALHYRKILRADGEHAEARRELEELIRRHARRAPEEK